MKKVQAKKEEDAREGPVVYCGPDIRNTVRQYTVFDGAVPEMVKALVREWPVIGNFIVPVSELARTRNAIGQQGTPENIWFNKIISEVNKK